MITKKRTFLKNGKRTFQLNAYKKAILFKLNIKFGTMFVTKSI